MKKLKTKITFSFQDQEELPQLTMETKKTKKKSTIKVIEHKFNKKPDPSTKLF